MDYRNLSGNTDTEAACRSNILVLRCEEGRKKGRKALRGLRDGYQCCLVAGEATDRWVVGQGVPILHLISGGYQEDSDIERRSRLVYIHK